MGDAWYDGEDTIVSDGIVYRRLPHSFYSLPPNQNVLRTLFDNCDLDQHFKAVFSPDKERLFSFYRTFLERKGYVFLRPLIQTDEGEWKTTIVNHEIPKFGSAFEKQPIIFVPESLYDIVVTPLVEFKSLRALALQGVRKIEVSDLNDASECKALFGDNIWVCWSQFVYRPDPGGLPEDDKSYTIERAAEAKFYNSKKYGPYYIAEFHNDWREVALKNMEELPWKSVCIFGMPEERIQEFKDAHPEFHFPDNHHKWHNIVLMSGSVSRKAAFIAHTHHSVRDWAA